MPEAFSALKFEQSGLACKRARLGRTLALSIKQDEPPCPIYLRLFSADAVMARTQVDAQPIAQLGRWRTRRIGRRDQRRRGESEVLSHPLNFRFVQMTIVESLPVVVQNCVALVDKYRYDLYRLILVSLFQNPSY